MRIRAVTLKNYRRHGQLAVSLDPHRTLITGPNEIGKSSLIEAIHRCLFYRHRSKAAGLLERMQPQTGGDYRLVGKTSDHNFTLNNASSYVRSADSLIYVRVVAVDRAGNKSTSISGQYVWYDALMAGSNDYRPQWLQFLENDPHFGATNNDYQYANNRRYELSWNDNGQASPFFDRYVILIRYFNSGHADPKTLFSSWVPSYILVETTRANHILYINQATSGSSIYLMVGVVDKFGNYYFYNDNAAVVEIPHT